MKPYKNKIVFVLVMASVVLFITVYALLTFGRDKEPPLGTDQIPLPDIGDAPTAYGSKMEALEAIKADREIIAPPIYPDHMVDEKGYFNPDYMEYEKQRIIDSMYQVGKHPPEVHSRSVPTPNDPKPAHHGSMDIDSPPPPMTIDSGALGLEHQLFFASNPLPNNASLPSMVPVRVNGGQTIRDGYRLELLLASDLTINGIRVPEYTAVYGFVKIRANRVLVEVSHLGKLPVALKGHDLQDGREGLYVEHHLGGAVVDQGLDESLGEVNIPGIPQLRGIRNIFRRDHRTIKVTIPANYQFILKP